MGKSLECDLLVGGPPCQGFSVQRRGEDTDERNHLVVEFSELISLIQPKVFLMENVGGLFGPRGKHVLEIFNNHLTHAGYKIKSFKLNALDYGVPQSRKRAFLLGARRDLPDISFVETKLNEHRTTERFTVRDAIEDLQDLGPTDIPNHVGDKLSKLNLERIQHLKPGQSRIHLPPHLILETHKRNPLHRHLDTYGRMDWDLPSPTITARFDSFSRGKFGHPENNRSITLREGARLQTFPDKFEFFGNKVEIARQIGNAVPVKLAEAIGHILFEFIEGSTAKNGRDLETDPSIARYSRIPS